MLAYVTGSVDEELLARNAIEGFSNLRCQCRETHRVARIRMNCGLGEPRSITEIKRVFRRVARRLGCSIPTGGLNIEVKRDRVDAVIVLEQESG